MRRCSTLLALFLLLTPLASEASRLSGGSLTWTRDATFMSTTQARFTLRLRLSLRASFYPPATIGQVITLPTVTVTPNGGPPNALAIPVTVLSVNPANDVLFTEGTANVVVDLAALPATVVYADCCRVTALANGNASQNFRLAATLVAAQRSADSSLLPRISLTLGQPGLLRSPSRPRFRSPSPFHRRQPRASSSPSRPASPSARAGRWRGLPRPSASTRCRWR